MSKKDEKSTKDSHSTAGSGSDYVSTSASNRLSEVNVADYQESANRSLDEMKNNIRQTVDEAKSQIPRYTQAVNEYQENTLQASKEIAEDFIESQKNIINSVQSAWKPFIESYTNMASYWLSPRTFTDIYSRTVSTVADNMISTTRLANNTIYAYMETAKASIRGAKEGAREFARISSNTAKTFENNARETNNRF